jgi:hypothetical protein
MVTADTMSPAIAARPAVYRGRRWSTAIMLILAALCAGLAVLTASLDDAWLAVMVMGLPLAAAALLCALSGWGEAIARVALDDSGLSLRLPNYRGVLPLSPAQRLDAAWPEVKGLRRRLVRGRLLAFALDYYEYRIAAESGEVRLIEPLRSPFWGEARGLRQNIPAGEIVAEISRRTGLGLHDDGEVRGGGVLGGILAGRIRPESAAPGTAAGAE